MIGWRCRSDDVDTGTRLSVIFEIPRSSSKYFHSQQEERSRSERQNRTSRRDDKLWKDIIIMTMTTTQEDGRMGRWWSRVKDLLHGSLTQLATNLRGKFRDVGNDLQTSWQGLRARWIRVKTLVSTRLTQLGTLWGKRGSPFV